MARATLMGVTYFDWDDAKREPRSGALHRFRETSSSTSSVASSELLEHPNPDRYSGQHLRSLLTITQPGRLEEV
jgi:hypothetical protein